MKIKLLLLVLTLLCLNSYAQITFENKVVIDNRNATTNPLSVFAADIDGDGDVDILSASADDNKIAWYKNIDGQGTYGEQLLISTEALSATSVFAFDIDGDSDIDVVSGSFYDNKIAWYENLDGQGTFGNQQIISITATGANHIVIADIDGDGDGDVLASLNYRISWYENIDGLGNYGPEVIINETVELARSVFSADIDGDGDLDVLSGAANGNQLSWYENLNSVGTFGSPQTITANTESIYSVYAADIDGDGDIDVISGAFDKGKIAWYENIDGQGNFGSQQIIVPDIVNNHARAVFPMDIDNDGDFDVVSSCFSFSTPTIVWSENLDGMGNFGPPQTVNTGTRSVQSIYGADIENDGDLDIIFCSEDTVGFHRNLDGNGNYDAQTYFTYNVDNPYYIDVVDLNGNGYSDVLSASFYDGEIAWYQNVDGYGNFGIQQTISKKNGSPNCVRGFDIDGDGDKDVLFSTSGTIFWHENLDGLGNFSEKKIISQNISSNIKEVDAADLDNDGDLDIISISSLTQRGLDWFENLDGLGTFGPAQSIYFDTQFVPVSVDLVDVNSDGNLDILTNSHTNGEGYWFENLGGGIFGPLQLITSSFYSNIQFMHGADVDGDNDVDVVLTKRIEGKIVWFENLDGQGDFGEEHAIASGLDTPFGIYTTDIDNDGDLDVLSVSIYGDVVDWYENIDGAGNFGPQNIIMNDADGTNFVLANDIDGDGDMDVIASLRDANEIRWFKNTLILGTNETATLNFSLYPNPTSNTLNIRIEKPIQQIEVYNKLGQLVTKNVVLLNDGGSELNVSKLATGVYFVKIKSADGEIGVERFIKK